MVDHLTRITADRASPRAGDLERALHALGFALRPEPGRVVGESSQVEAGEAKARLRAAGIPDREYRVFVEFVRRWGIL